MTTTQKSDASQNNSPHAAPPVNGCRLLEHKSKGTYTNNHFINMKTGVATVPQIKEVLNRAIRQAEIKLGRSLKTSYKITLVSDIHGNIFGYGYAWVTNHEVFNVLVGRNPDGTERVDYIQDPKWVPPTEEEILAFESAPISNWADAAIMSDQLYDPPKIKVQLPAIVELEPYVLTPFQQDQIKGDPNGKSFMYKGEFTHGIIECTVGTTSGNTDTKYQSTVLCCKKIPEDLTEEDIKVHFVNFVEDPNRTATRRLNGVVTVEKYPLVKISKQRVCFITFASEMDASFSLKMNHKLEITKNKKLHLLIFNRAYSSDHTK